MESTSANWRKSTYSGNNGTDCVVVRDTTDRAGAVLSFPATAWLAFAATIRADA